jgi:hypothetical protein
MQIWPNGGRYLWTDAFGVVLLVSLYRIHDDRKYIEQAGATAVSPWFCVSNNARLYTEWLVSEVNRVLGRPKCLRIGQEADRYGR